jgi:hypothetical protein
MPRLMQPTQAGSSRTEKPCSRRTQESGIPVEGRTNVNAIRSREGKVVEWLLGLDSKDQAREAVGLRDG